MNTASLYLRKKGNEVVQDKDQKNFFGLITEVES